MTPLTGSETPFVLSLKSGEGPTERQAAPPDRHTPPLHRLPMERGPGGEVPSPAPFALSEVEGRTADTRALPPHTPPLHRLPMERGSVRFPLLPRSS